MSRIQKLEEELGSLYTLSIEISELYKKDIFLEQEKLAVTLENLFIAATHETATQVGFIRANCIELIKYIEFREENSIFSDVEIKEAIDGSILLDAKKELLHKFENTKDVLNAINKLKSNWNDKLNNLGYQNFKMKYKI